MPLPVSLSTINYQRSIATLGRKHKHEEHANHEAWAIPYGDLITLLLAFFVVMYAISTVNEGKYRALSDSMSAAFKGTPRSPDPINVGDRNSASHQSNPMRLDPQGNPIGDHHSELTSKTNDLDKIAELAKAKAGKNEELTPMDAVIGSVEASMADLIKQDMLVVRRKGYGVEIEIRTDILFPSGSATMAPTATSVLQRLADTLKTLPYAMRVEGHTDNRPINTTTFPSNWELSAARAASVVHLFMERGVDPSRLAVIGLGEFRPIADNSTEAGRNINRRVMVVILSDASKPETEQKKDEPVVEATALQASLAAANVGMVRAK